MQLLPMASSPDGLISARYAGGARGECTTKLYHSITVQISFGAFAALYKIFLWRLCRLVFSMLFGPSDCSPPGGEGGVRTRKGHHVL